MGFGVGLSLKWLGLCVSLRWHAAALEVGLEVGLLLMRISCAGLGESVEIMVVESGCLLGLLLGMFSLVLLKVVVLAKCKSMVSILTIGVVWVGRHGGCDAEDYEYME